MEYCEKYMQYLSGAIEMLVCMKLLYVCHYYTSSSPCPHSLAAGIQCHAARVIIVARVPTCFASSIQLFSPCFLCESLLLSTLFLESVLPLSFLPALSLQYTQNPTYSHVTLASDPRNCSPILRRRIARSLCF